MTTTHNLQKTELRTFQNREFKVLLKEAIRPELSDGRFPPLQPGSVVEEGIRIDRDVAVKLRDGTTIYVDIYRPDGVKEVPAIVAWSPYGKRLGYAAPMVVSGVPMGTLSPATKTEGPDPAYWCRQGYAVVNPDPRGVGNSEGVVQIWSRQEARDSADLIEWIAVQDWCNHRVGMAGNSWLAISQWAAAAERPPHLACIAPWEGSTDVYRQIFCRGGIPDKGFSHYFNLLLVGTGLSEDVVGNLQAHPFHDDYWNEKISDLERIEVPAYVTASWQHFHLPGSIEGFNRIRSQTKWLRIHREFEWPDFYTPENLADLGRFFERYLKGHHNGWEMTPPVRIDVMDRGDRDHAVRRPEVSFPLPDTRYRCLFLDAATSNLKSELPDTPAEISYDASSGLATFDMTVDSALELTGYFKLRLWVEARGADDLDLFVVVQKADENGRVIPTLVASQAHPGAEGMLRVSHRELDSSKSTDLQPVHTHMSEQRLKPGEIVPVELSIWPTSRFWHVGERLRLTIAGHYVREPGWFEPLTWNLRNQGTHVIHTGGTYDSYLMVPEIPAIRPVTPGQSVTAASVSMVL